MESDAERAFAEWEVTQQLWGWEGGISWNVLSGPRMRAFNCF